MVQQKQQQNEQLPTAQRYGVSDSPFPLYMSMRPVVALIPDRGVKRRARPGISMWQRLRKANDRRVRGGA